MNKERTSIFIKKENWWWVRNTILAELYNVTFGKNFSSQTSLDDDAIGAGRITLESITKSEVDILMSDMPDLMVRLIDSGRFDNWQGGNLILEARMKDTPRIDFDGSDTYPWKFSVNVNILKWEGRNE